MISPTPPFLAQNVIQRTNQPWDRNGADVYGRKSRLTFSEAIGVTGGTQTTNLDASLNGKFFGKFVNVATHMGNTDGAALLTHHYPQGLCTVWTDKPHSEDYLLTALETEWHANGGNWLTRYPYQGGQQQQQSLLSLRMNRSPCPRCAKNLHRYCRARNLSLRVKATFMHPDTDAKGRTGTSLLDSKSRPVRQWDTDRVLAKAPKGAPVNIDNWNAAQKDKSSNPYKVFDRDLVEAGQMGQFQAERTNHNIPLLTGWSAAPGNLSRATIQNKRGFNPFPPPPIKSPSGSTVLRKPIGPPVPPKSSPALLKIQRSEVPACTRLPFVQLKSGISDADRRLLLLRGNSPNRSAEQYATLKRVYE